MAAFASDDFSEASGTAVKGKALDIGGTWSSGAIGQNYDVRTDGTGSTYTGSVASGSYGATVASSASIPSADYIVSGTLIIKSVLAQNFASVCARSSTSGGNQGYTLVYTGSAFRLGFISGSTFTQLGSQVPFTLGAGASANIAVKVQGTTISGIVNGSTIITQTDSTFTSAGFPGITFSNNGNNSSATTGQHIGAFSADPIVVNTPITVTPAGSYTLTGGSATFTTVTGINFMVNPGAYTLTGGAATFTTTQTFPIVVTPGVYAYNGGTALFGGKSNITADAGRYTLNGGAANFDIMCPEVLPINSTLTASDIIKNAMIDLGVLSAGEAPTGEETDVGIRVLNWMLKTWQSRGVTSWRNVECFITFPPGVTTMVLDHYCIDVIDARLQQAPNYERPLQRWELAQYRQIPNKQTPGYPTSYTISKTSNTISMTVWPVPYVPMTVNYSYARIIRDVVDGTDEVDIPQEWLEAVTLGLAARLTSSLGVNRIDPATAVDIKQRAAATEQLLFDEDRSASVYMGSSYGRRF